MLHFTPSVAGGLAVGTAATLATLFTLATNPSAPSPKTDRLPANTLIWPENKRISVVEVVGLRDAAIVYRDREGRLLFSTDPVANVTVVTKNLALPEVTLRDTADSQVQRVPIENMRAPESDKAGPIQGCESGLSPDISPTVPVAKDRCVVELKPSTDVASLR
jgi:hypothetical protein